MITTEYIHIFDVRKENGQITRTKYANSTNAIAKKSVKTIGNISGTYGSKSDFFKTCTGACCMLPR